MMENISVNIKPQRSGCPWSPLHQPRLFMTQQSLLDPNWAIGHILTILFQAMANTLEVSNENKQPFSG